MHLGRKESLLILEVWSGLGTWVGIRAKLGYREDKDPVDVLMGHAREMPSVMACVG